MPQLIEIVDAETAEPRADLGKLGDVVTVKNGYARNYLIPQKKALRATNENISVFENQRAEYEAQSRDHQTKEEGLAKTQEYTLQRPQTLNVAGAKI